MVPESATTKTSIADIAARKHNARCFDSPVGVYAGKCPMQIQPQRFLRWHLRCVDLSIRCQPVQTEPSIAATSQRANTCCRPQRPREAHSLDQLSGLALSGSDQAVDAVQDAVESEFNVIDR
jgi:hypothetical protein